MDTEKLQELFCTKIGMELEHYKRKVLRLEPEEIYHRAYQIDSIINIYEILVEHSRKMTGEMLQVMLVMPGLLAYFYRKWMKYGDSVAEELQECIRENVDRLCMVFPKILQEEKERAA